MLLGNGIYYGHILTKCSMHGLYVMTIASLPSMIRVSKCKAINNPLIKEHIPLPSSIAVTEWVSRSILDLYMRLFLSSSFLHWNSWWSNKKKCLSTRRPAELSFDSSPEWINSELLTSISSSCNHQIRSVMNGATRN